MPFVSTRPNAGPYSTENLVKILGALGITASPSAITLAIEQPYKEGHTGSLSDLAALIGWLQSIASSYLSYRDYENGPRFKELRRNLRRIASEGLLPFPPHYRERLISWHQLKPLLKTFDQIKKNADQILNELPPRGPLATPLAGAVHDRMPVMLMS
jgi:hypothetical protein